MFLYQNWPPVQYVHTQTFLHDKTVSITKTKTKSHLPLSHHQFPSYPPAAVTSAATVLGAD